MNLYARIARWFRMRRPPKPFVPGMTLLPGESAEIPVAALLRQAGLPPEAYAEAILAAEEGRLHIVVNRGDVEIRVAAKS